MVTAGAGALLPADPLGGGGGDDVWSAEGGGGGSGTEQEWNYDPSEPRYCVCNQVSYGDMVACDNSDVSLLLFSIFLFHCARLLILDNGEATYDKRIAFMQNQNCHQTFHRSFFVIQTTDMNF